MCDNCDYDDDNNDLCDGVRSSVEEPWPLLIIINHSDVLDSIAGDAVKRRRVPRHLDDRHRQTTYLHV